MKGLPSSSSILTWPGVSIPLTSCGIRKWKLMTWNTFFFFFPFIFLNLIYSGCLKSGIITWILILSVACSLTLKLRLTITLNLVDTSCALAMLCFMMKNTKVIFSAKRMGSEGKKNTVVSTSFNSFAKESSWYERTNLVVLQEASSGIFLWWVILFSCRKRLLAFIRWLSLTGMVVRKFCVESVCITNAN